MSLARFSFVSLVVDDFHFSGLASTNDFTTMLLG